MKVLGRKITTTNKFQTGDIVALALCEKIKAKEEYQFNHTGVKYKVKTI